MSSNYSEKIERPSSQVGKIPDNLKASNILDDDFMNSVGLYSKKDIDEARFTRYSRFGRLLDPQGKLNDCREYLFFTKPDLHITKTGDEAIYKISGGKSSDIIQYGDLVLNPQLGGSPYFRSLLWSHPEVVKQLQREATANTNKDPFCRLLSSSVNSYLDIPGSEASTMDNPSTMLGATYDYLNNSENSDENPTFSLDFLDNKHLDVYHFFRAYSEYHILRKSGLVTPPSMKYYWYKRLHNVMGIYKFIVAEDMETIVYWAYYWGVYPTSVPRESFSDPLFADGVSLSVSFKAAFVEDMNPLILQQFNELMAPMIKDTSNWMPVVKQNVINDLDRYGKTHSYDPNMNSNITLNGVSTDTNGDTIPYTSTYNGNNPSSRIDGRLPKYALVDANSAYDTDYSRRYKLRWYLE